MEATLYDDQEYGAPGMESVQQQKRRLTLDLAAAPEANRPRGGHLLSSPDLRLLKLGSPELERMIAQQGGLVTTTPTPGGPQAISAVLERTATDEQEDYALGFVNALHSLRQERGEQRVPSSSAGGADSSPPASPVDMERQERIKLERKRQRNRIAATKCRQRKLERIARLEERVQAIRQDNRELAQLVGRLREQVNALNQELREHSQHGCEIRYPAPSC